MTRPGASPATALETPPIRLRWRADPTQEPARSIIELARVSAAAAGVLSSPAPALVEVRAAAASEAAGPGGPQHVGSDGPGSVDTLVAALLSAGCLTLSVGDADDPSAVLEPMTSQFSCDVDAPLPEAIQLSRFAFLRGIDGQTVLESPLSLARLRVPDPTLAGLIPALTAGVSTDSFVDAAPDPALASGLARLLVAGGFAGAATAAGCALDAVDTMRQWDFADLLFHSRSRLGRHDYPMGGTFRFSGELPPPPVTAARAWPTTVPLPRPTGPAALDRGLIEAMERRRSVREQSAVPLSVRELGEFLYHSARIRGYLPGPHGLTLSNRPYPTGGASYELEIYLTVNACMGLAPGFYHYDAAAHGLAPISPPNEHTQQLLLGAYTSCGRTCYPQVLISIASRFQRIAWKYTGIAYATTLKNVGILYSTFYLVGTAMGLAPCALGLGDSETFAALAGTDRWAESSVGEFMLGGRALGVQQ